MVWVVFLRGLACGTSVPPLVLVLGGDRWWVWVCSLCGLTCEAVCLGLVVRSQVVHTHWFGHTHDKEGGLALGGFHPGGLRVAPWFRKRQALLFKLILFLWRFDRGAGVVQPTCPVLRGQGHGQNVVTGFYAPIRGALIMQPLR